MEIMTTTCAACGRDIHILEEYAKEKMWCSLECVDAQTKQIET